MPELDEVLGCHPAAGQVVVRHGVGAGQRCPAAGDDDRGAGGDDEVRVGFARDHQTLDAHGQEALDGGDVQPGVEEAVRDDESVPLVLQ